MSFMTSQIVGISAVCAIFFQANKKDTPKLRVTVRWFHRWPANASHSEPIMLKVFLYFVIHIYVDSEN